MRIFYFIPSNDYTPDIQNLSLSVKKMVQLQ
jgi:hypothetical protein